VFVITQDAQHLFIFLMQDNSITRNL